MYLAISIDTPPSDKMQKKLREVMIMEMTSIYVSWTDF